MKYIIIKCYGLEIPILFDEVLSHDSISASGKIISAGFCSKYGRAYGKSTSLELKSRPEDTEIIQKSMERTI